MKLKPLHDWAVVRPSEALEVTAGGLYIPDTAKDKPQQGVVEAIGPGAYIEEKNKVGSGGKKERKFVPTTVKPGDAVIYERYAGQTYKIDGEELILVRERSILGTLPGGIAAHPRPLQIPAVTSGSAATALMKPGASSHSPSMRGATIEKPAKQAVKKAAKKAAKKTAAKKKQAGKEKPPTKKVSGGKKTIAAGVRKKAKKKTGKK